MQCVILAGGLATRMRPLTETIPKALITVGNVPFIDHQLDWLSSHGVTDVVLSIGYRGRMLADHVGDGGRWGLRVLVVDEGEQLQGTAGALRFADQQGVLEPAFLVTYGDSFLPVDFAAVWARFQACGQRALMTVFRNDGQWDKSNAIFQDEMVVLYDKAHATRPAQAFSYIDYGLLALDREVVRAKVPSAGKADLAELLHGLSVAGQLAGLEVHERFYEIGSPAGLEDFSRWIAARD
ncbi:MAG TPA: sugar phosphate nucleotidyltransferase [Polyangia bacterium]|nr:sugar phosphate nucleotidyltransferase [Polyangia bacterium]